MDLTGRTVVVTGATGALGTAVVGAARAAGARVVAPTRGPDAGGWPHADHVRVVADVDLTDEQAVDRLYDAAVAEGPLWASIHVAGGFAMGGIVDTSVATLRQQLDMNAVATWLCCRAAARRMTDGGRLVNVAARPALVPTADVSAYAMAKGAIVALTHTLSEELSPRGIWVNAVVPSLIDTPANRRAMPDADHGRWPSPEAIASTMLHLASPANAVARGAIVPVYGRA